jgi:hypothetical protein
MVCIKIIAKPRNTPCLEADGIIGGFGIVVISSILANISVSSPHVCVRRSFSVLQGSKNFEPKAAKLSIL